MKNDTNTTAGSGLHDADCSLDAFRVMLSARLITPIGEAYEIPVEIKVDDMKADMMRQVPLLCIGITRRLKKLKIQA